MPPRPQAAAAFSPAPAAQPRPAPVQQAVRPPPKKPVLIDVTPQTLSVQTVQDNCESVIERNSTIPIEQTRNFSTSHDDQVGVLIRICQGESKRASENVILGEVTLEGLRPAPRGEVTIAVTFEIDPDGILQVSARDVETGRAQITRITLFGGMSEDAVQAAMKRAIL
jgi:molecular chaperone DnaK